MKCEVRVDNHTIQYSLDNDDVAYGPPTVLAEREADILGTAPWYPRGYTLERIFEKLEVSNLKAAVTAAVKGILENLGFDKLEDFRLEDYHKTVTTAAAHQEVIQKTRNLTFSDIGFDFSSATQRIGTVCRCQFKAKNPRLREDIIIIRISRPHSEDFNPPHKDGYLELWERTVNLWIPVAGCNRESSLAFVPGSHLLSENKIKRTQSGALMNGKKYHVPAIVEWEGGSNQMQRSDINDGEILIFSPLLVHGCAKNFNQDETRVSIELRLNA